MQRSEPVFLISVWVSPFGDLTEGNVPPELWARAMRLPCRKGSLEFDYRFRGVRQTVSEMEAIAFERWEGPLVTE